MLIISDRAYISNFFWKSKISWRISLLSIKTKSGLLPGLRDSFVSQSLREFYAFHFL